ncbi:MAG: hypothetical protein GVY25_09220 [Bacteroidetes bacterium]|jgi:hypothetical protein|nr:hypothetical protein [Bacteroidota bacterium]
MRNPFSSIPANIRWPMFIIGLLSISITASAYTFYKAHSDGGPAIVENYYEKGKNWNASAEARRNGGRLDVEIRVLPATGDNNMRPVEVTVRDSTGATVDDLTGMIRGLRPHLAAPVASVPLRSVDGTPGTYRQLLPMAAGGIWDFEIDGSLGETPIQTTIRVRL